MLWQYEQDYDPLPDLQQNPVAPETESAITRCIQEVHYVNTLQSLIDQCHDPSINEGMIPNLTPLARNPTAESLGELAVALITLRQGDIPILNEISDDQDEHGVHFNILAE